MLRVSVSLPRGRTEKLLVERLSKVGDLKIIYISYIIYSILYIYIYLVYYIYIILKSIWPSQVPGKATACPAPPTRASGVVSRRPIVAIPAIPEMEIPCGKPMGFNSDINSDINSG